MGETLAVEDCFEVVGPDPDDPASTVPRVIRRFEAVDPPPFMLDPPGEVGRTESELEDLVAEFAPWHQRFDLGSGVLTRTGLPGDVAAHRIAYRRELINGTVEVLLGDELGQAVALDIGCHSGFFTFDLAHRGATVVGVDLRPENIAQCRVLAEHYGAERVDFRLVDAEDGLPDGRWDVVLNLGLLYHVTDPVGLLRSTFDATGRLAVVDTVCRVGPESAFHVVRGKDVGRSTEGRWAMEVHPTPSAVVDTLLGVGYRDVYEVVADVERDHDSYAQGRRRCFLALR